MENQQVNRTQNDETVTRQMTVANQNNVYRQGLNCQRAAMAATAFGVKGMVVITRGIHSQGHEFTEKAKAAVAGFDDFTEENNPHNECDFGSLEVDGTQIFWKIDLYNNTLDAGSNDPADPLQTHRVLTILLPSEY